MHIHVRSVSLKIKVLHEKKAYHVTQVPRKKISWRIYVLTKGSWLYQITPLPPPPPLSLKSQLAHHLHYHNQNKKFQIS